MTSQELKERKAEIVQKVEDLDDLSKSEKRELTPEENKEVDTHLKDIDILDKQIQRASKVEAMRTMEAKKKGQTPKNSPEDKRALDVGKYRLFTAIQNTYNGKQLDGIEAELHKESEIEAARNGLPIEGIGLPSPNHINKLIGKRDLDVTNATMGTETVQTDIGGLIPVLRPKLLTQEMGAQVLNGLQGNLTLPTHATATSATAEGEDDANAESTPTFGTVALTPSRIGAYTEITKQLLNQSSIDVENLVRNDLSRAMSTYIDDAIYDMIIAKTGTGSVAGGTNGAVPDFADIVDLETAVAVDNAEMGTLAYVTTPGIRGLLKQTLKTAGVGGYIWEANQLNGYNAYATTQVPSDGDKGTSTGVCHSIIYGNWQELIIGFWGGLDIVVDPYSLSKTAKIQLVVNRWYDADVRHAESFATMEDALLS